MIFLLVICNRRVGFTLSKMINSKDLVHHLNFNTTLQKDCLDWLCRLESAVFKYIFNICQYCANIVILEQTDLLGAFMLVMVISSVAKSCDF